MLMPELQDKLDVARDATGQGPRHMTLVQELFEEDVLGYVVPIELPNRRHRRGDAAHEASRDDHGQGQDADREDALRDRLGADGRVPGRELRERPVEGDKVLDAEVLLLELLLYHPAATFPCSDPIPHASQHVVHCQDEAQVLYHCDDHSYELGLDVALHREQELPQFRQAHEAQQTYDPRHACELRRAGHAHAAVDARRGHEVGDDEVPIHGDQWHVQRHPRPGVLDDHLPSGHEQMSILAVEPCAAGQSNVHCPIDERHPSVALRPIVLRGLEDLHGQPDKVGEQNH
mmetsp:Transcript_82531/g.266099  ORF Transcript_82531/g.266099 Transcript_82531/m.266099 type:complete len:289 (-) Transcript_82531:1389-2255(-)